MVDESAQSDANLFAAATCQEPERMQNPYLTIKIPYLSSSYVGDAMINLILADAKIDVVFVTVLLIDFTKARFVVNRAEGSLKARSV
ncbi:hypothetical protein F2P81_008981 [Scophthalmus maximus]|uniref:Uncharacterized protein n=1 Tax=Scophthalmus maximus TaxID=52904 RepID=A0A6A4SY16_SCOMX|nr:hypothetical protein F2P81_008981 [Scophthalmus maximus]